jgi:hypothetical protein
VPAHLIAGFAAGIGNDTEELLFGFELEFEVTHCPALQADQMVVVAAQPLSQLVTSDLALPVMKRQQPGFFQYRQRAIEG